MDKPTPEQKRQWQQAHPVVGRVFTGGHVKPPKTRTYPDWWLYPQEVTRSGIQRQCPHDPRCTITGWADWACGTRQLEER